MKSILKFCLYILLFGMLAACADQGGAALDGSFGGESSFGGPVGGGQGQPTIAPGADHQPGIPVDEEEGNGPSDIAAPGQDPEPPPNPSPGFDGPKNFTN